MKSILVILISLSSAASFAGDKIRIAAGAAPIDNIFKKIEASFEAANPGVDLVFDRTDPKGSLERLDKGEADGAAIAFPAEEWLKKAKAEGYQPKDIKEYKSRVIGRDLMVIIKNKQNSVPKLSKAQLKKIFSGEAKNWSELGGGNQPIVVIYHGKLVGLNKYISESLLGGAELSKAAKVLTEPTDEIKFVKAEVVKQAGGIAFVPEGAKDESIGAFETEPMGRPITFMTLGVPSEKVLKLLDFISKQGSSLGSK